MAGIKWDDPQKSGGVQWDTPNSNAPTPHVDATPDAYDDHIVTAAQKHGLEPKFLKAVGYKETRLGTGAGYDRKTNRGDGGHGYGIFQLDDRTPGREHLLPKVASDPGAAADTAAQMLSNLLKQYGGDKRKALAAYNAGSPTAQGLAYADSVLGYEPQMSLRAPAKPPVRPSGGGWGVGSDKPWNPPPLPPAKKYTPLEQFGAATNIRPIVGAIGDGRFGDYVDMVFKEHNPAKAKDEFDVLTPDNLKYSAMTGNQNAKWILQHPKLLVAGTLFMDVIDPLSNLAGGVVGKGLAKGFKYVGSTNEGRYLLNAFSPLRSIAEAGGMEGKRAIQALLVKVSSSPAQGQHVALKIFGGLDKQAQEDVVHTFQGEHDAVKTTNPHTLGLIQERAKTLEEYRVSLDARQLEKGVLPERTAAENDHFFGMQGAYKNDGIPTNTARLNQEIHGSGAGGNVSSEGTIGTPSQFKTLHEGQTQSKYGLNDDFGVVSQFEKSITHGLKNVAFEEAAGKIPKTLLIKNAEKVPLGTTAPLDAAGRPMSHYTDLDKSVRGLFEFSPSLKGAYISDTLVKHLVKNSTRLFEDELIKNPTTAKEKAIAGAMKVWSGYNNATRTAIISNPLIHPLWNLSNNSRGAGLPPMETAMLVTRSVFNTLGGGKLLDKFLPRSQEYQQYLQEAIKEGALAEMRVGSTETTRRLASRWEDLNTTGKVAKLFDKANAWNNRLTFGKEGEEAFSTAVYRHLTKMGVPKSEAAGQVREALGNYQNVSKSGADGVMSQVSFFWPWLKGNTTFWARSLVTHPSITYAPADAARMNNQIVNDPEEKKRRANDFEFKIKNKDGSFGSFTPMLPARRTVDILNAVTSGDPNQMIREGAKIASGVAVPVLGAAIDAYGTYKAPAADPRMPQNYQTIYNKSETDDTKWKQVAAYAAGKAPIPVFGYAARDAIRQGGVKPQDIPGIVGGTAIGGYSREDADPKAQRQTARAEKALSSQMFRAKQIKDPERKAAAEQRAHNTYNKRVQKFLPGGAKTAKPTVTWDAAPTGVVWDK